MPPQPNEKGPGPKRRWRGVRRTLFGLRLSILLAVLLVVVSLFYLNKIGLPLPAKQRILAQLQSQGWQAQFSRLRWRWDRGIVVENLHVQREGKKGGPCLFVSEAQCRFNRDAYWKGRLEVEALILEEGRLIWLLTETNLPRLYVQLNDLHGGLYFHPNNLWELRSLRARGLGAHYLFNGFVTNASALRDLKLPEQPAQDPKIRTARWQRLLHQIQQVKFAEPPELACSFRGDARDFPSFQAQINLSTPAVQSPWGSGTNVSVSLQLLPRQNPQEPMQVECSTAAERVLSPWGQAEVIKIYMTGQPTFNDWLPANIYLAAELQGAQTDWARASLAVLTARSVAHPTNAQLRLTECLLQTEKLLTGWGSSVRNTLQVSTTHALTNFCPASWNLTAQVHEVQSRWGATKFATLESQGRLARWPDWGATNLTWPERLASLSGRVSGTFTNLSDGRLDLDWLGVNGSWEPPGLEVQGQGWLGQGPFAAELSLDTGSRLVKFLARSQGDPFALRPILTTNAQNWLAKFAWETPPRLEVSGSLALPPWTNRPFDWRNTVRPTVALQGSFQTGYGAYRDVPFLSAQASFRLQNDLWQVEQLRVLRPEGFLEGDYVSSLHTRDFHWHVNLCVLPQAARPLLETDKQKRAFEYFECRSPPHIQAEISGNWNDPSRLSFQGQVTATNFSIRNEPIERVSARVYYTNRLLHIYQPEAFRTLTETARADGILIDFTTQKLYLTNASGSVQVHPVSRMISPDAQKAMELFRLDEPVRAQVRGVVDLKKKSYNYDMEYIVSGGSFQWQMFRLSQFSTRLLWLGQTLTITNAQADLHQGSVTGSASFDFEPFKSANFAFAVEMTNVNFHTFTEQISRKTNQLEGRLSGGLVVTSANTTNWQSWQGYGHTLLQDGLIWDIPLFGVFSPILNAIVPGLGKSLARQATTSFTITNSIIHTRDLEVRATAMRMQFKGRGDFQQRIEGRMEAELLRDMPGLGLVISKILWPVTKLFEYKISGTLAQPKTEPVYLIPKIVLFPLNPIKGFRDLFLPEPRTPPLGTPAPRESLPRNSP
jgi:hypothetical protein